MSTRSRLADPSLSRLASERGPPVNGQCLLLAGKHKQSRTPSQRGGQMWQLATLREALLGTAACPCVIGRLCDTTGDLHLTTAIVVVLWCWSSSLRHLYYHSPVSAQTGERWTTAGCVEVTESLGGWSRSVGSILVGGQLKRPCEISVWVLFVCLCFILSLFVDTH